MKNEVALKFLKQENEQIKRAGIEARVAQVNKVAIKALGKQISKKPTKTQIMKGDFIAGRCPTCGKAIDGIYDRNYCNHYGCGQALKWEE